MRLTIGSVKLRHQEHCHYSGCSEANFVYILKAKKVENADNPFKKLFDYCIKKPVTFY